MGIVRNDSLFVPHSHIIKMRVVYPVLSVFLINRESSKIVGFSYEHVIAKKRSYNIGIDIGRIYYNAIYSGRLSMSNGISLYPEYRFYPFNKRTVYPRGFYISPSLSFGFFSGWDERYSQVISQTGTTITSSWVKTGRSDFRVITTGVGGVLGWQYFLGKRKRFTMSLSLALYASKNFILYESYPINDNYRMYPKKNKEPTGYLGVYLGYTFGKQENKKAVTP
jgi:hypothetical protein